MADDVKEGVDGEASDDSTEETKDDEATDNDDE